MADTKERNADPLAVLLLEDQDAADCDRGCAGHPAQTVSCLLELLADPDASGLSVQCPECQRPLQFDPGWH